MDVKVLWMAISGKLIVLAILTGLDFLLGTLLAISQKRFEWQRLADYLTSDGLPIVGWLAAEVILWLPGELIPAGVSTAVLTGVYGTVLLAILGSVLSHLAAIGVLRSQFQRVGVVPTGGHKP